MFSMLLCLVDVEGFFEDWCFDLRIVKPLSTYLSYYSTRWENFLEESLPWPRLSLDALPTAGFTAVLSKRLRGSPSSSLITIFLADGLSSIILMAGSTFPRSKLLSPVVSKRGGAIVVMA